MRNELIDVSTLTCIANFPEISNLNNRSIEAEFDLIKSDDNYVILDVSAANIHGYKGNFTNLEVKSINILDGTKHSTLRQYISDILADSDYVKEIVNKYDTLQKTVYNSDSLNQNTVAKVNTLTENQVYGASEKEDVPEYDMSAFFSSQPTGIIKGITVSDLYKSRLYRIMDNNIKIPLQVGTIFISGRLKYMVYHDHIMVNGSVKKCDRVYSPVSNGIDKNSVIQYDAASTITLSLSN